MLLETGLLQQLLELHWDDPDLKRVLEDDLVS